MTNQEFLNNAYIAFVVDGQEPGVAENGCAYRTADGGKCAIGVSIPDELYDEEMDIGVDGDSYTVAGLVDAFPELESLFEGANPEFLKELQRAHDDAVNAYQFYPAIRDRLTDLASRWGLTIPTN